MKKRIILQIFLALIMIFAIANAEDGWIKEGDYLYYYKDETKVIGTQTIDGVIRFFSDNGAYIGDGSIVELNGEKYYIGKDNKLKTGWQTIDEITYYFEPDTGSAIWGYGVVEIGNESYLFQGNMLLKNQDYFNGYKSDKDGKATKLKGGYQVSDKWLV